MTELHPGGTADHDDDKTLAPDGFRLTDTGNAARFIKLANRRVRFVAAWGSWLVYQDGRARGPPPTTSTPSSGE